MVPLTIQRFIRPAVRASLSLRASVCVLSRAGFAAGIVFEEEGYSVGMLKMPPNSTKGTERTNQTEVRPLSRVSLLVECVLLRADVFYQQVQNAVRARSRLGDRKDPAQPRCRLRLLTALWMTWLLTLIAGDSFVIPVGNSYSLRNLSKVSRLEPVGNVTLVLRRLRSRCASCSCATGPHRMHRSAHHHSSARAYPLRNDRLLSAKLEQHRV